MNICGLISRRMKLICVFRYQTPALERVLTMKHGTGAILFPEVTHFPSLSDDRGVCLFQETSVMLL